MDLKATGAAALQITSWLCLAGGNITTFFGSAAMPALVTPLDKALEVARATTFGAIGLGTTFFGIFRWQYLVIEDDVNRVMEALYRKARGTTNINQEA